LVVRAPFRVAFVARERALAHQCIEASGEQIRLDVRKRELAAVVERCRVPRIAQIPAQHGKFGGAIRRIHHLHVRQGRKAAQDGDEPLGASVSRGVEVVEEDAVADERVEVRRNAGTPPNGDTTLAVRLSQMMRMMLGRRIRSRVGGAAAGSASRLSTTRRAVAASMVVYGSARPNAFSVVSECATFHGTLSAAWFANSLLEKYTLL